MISKVRYRELDGQGVRLFTITEAINVPLLTEETKYAGKNKTFIKHGKFYGMPVEMEILRKGEGDNFVPYGRVTGFMVEEEGGVYLIPAPITAIPEEGDDGFGKQILDVADNISDEVVDETKQVLETVKHEADKFNVERTLGFSYKQLAVIAVSAIVIFKLIK